MIPDHDKDDLGTPRRVVEFPAGRILWARTARDEVAVTHRGQTTIYASPAELGEAILAAQPNLNDRLDALDNIERRARDLVAEIEARRLNVEARAGDLTALERAALQRLAAARAAERQAARLLRTLRRALLVAASLAVIVFVLGA